MYDVLKTATERVANLLTRGTPTNQFPLEIWTRIFDLAVDHGSEEHTKQVIPLTHVCQYWRTILLSYPRMWSTVYMKPGNPTAISKWLVRSQNAPLTVIAEFTDFYEHPPCLYEDSAIATLAYNNDDEVCHRHEAILSLNRLLPHRSRIRDLSILLHSSDPYWDDDEGDHVGEPTLLYHQFFRQSLPNLQRLDFCAVHVEQTRYMIPIPDSLFANNLPGLKELRFLGVTRGLTTTVKNLVSCEIGCLSESAGPTIFYPDELLAFFDNNKTVKSLTINECEFLADGPWVPAVTSMTDLKFFKIECLFDRHLEKILNFIRAPQFKDLDTIHLSLPPSFVEVVATDGSGHTLEFSRSSRDRQNFDPLQYFGAVITTLRMDPGITLEQLGDEPESYDLFRSFDAVQVLEFEGVIADFVQNALSTTGVFPGLRVIRVAVSRHDCVRVLRSLAIASKRRMMEGNPLTTIEPLLVEEDGLDESLRVEWEESYKAEDVHNSLSG